QIDDRNDHAAQIEHAADIFRLSGKRRDRRPSLDLPHRHDVDAILIVADGKADQLIGGYDGVRSANRTSGRLGVGRRGNGEITHHATFLERLQTNDGYSSDQSLRSTVNFNLIACTVDVQR